MEEADAVARVARRALVLCHFDPDSGQEMLPPGRTCVAACYECLLSYSNQSEHRFIDRWAIRDFLLDLASSSVVLSPAGRSPEEQYEWLKGLTDPKSGLEIPFLYFLYKGRYRLPDAAQNRPCEEVPAQPDFYYERPGVPGACVFVDGAGHQHPLQAERDAQVRQALEDRGYRVISIRFDQDLKEQVNQHPDIFGAGAEG